MRHLVSYFFNVRKYFGMDEGMVVFNCPAWSMMDCLPDILHSPFLLQQKSFVRRPSGYTMRPYGFCEWRVNKTKSKYAGRVIKCESCREPVSGWCKNLLANKLTENANGAAGKSS